MSESTKRIGITDVVLRDAHQSLFATRLRIDDMLPIAQYLDDIGYWSLECWGGATFDSCIRFLGKILGKDCESSKKRCQKRRCKCCFEVKIYWVIAITLTTSLISSLSAP